MSAIQELSLSFCLWIFLKTMSRLCSLAIQCCDSVGSQSGITAVCSCVGSLEVDLVAD